MRDYKFDNIRFVLIFLVVLGHFIAPAPSVKLDLLNEFIYTFHMPVFVFISGYFAKFDTQRVTRTYLYSYVMMQIFYFFFLKYYMGNINTKFSLSIPYYTLWYLFAMVIYTMIIPLIQTESKNKKLIILLISLCISLFAGVEESMGYLFAAARTFAFLPFFVLGYYCRTSPVTQKLNALKANEKVILGFGIAAILAAIQFFIIKSPLIAPNDMTATTPYIHTQWGWKARAVMIIASVLWIAFFLIATPSKKIPIISNIGANTFPVYILHGVAVKIFVKNNIPQLDTKLYFVLAIATSLAVLVILGNKKSAKIIKMIFTGQWIGIVEKLAKPEQKVEQKIEQ